jgi:hypothetical protein
MGTSGRLSCDNSNEHLVFIKAWESIDHIRNNQLFNYVAPWSQLCVNTVQFLLDSNDNPLPRSLFNFSTFLLFFSLYELRILACSNPELASEIMNHLSNYLRVSIYLWLYSPCGPWSLFQFRNLYTVSGIRWEGDQPVARPLPTHRATQTQNRFT